MGESCDDGTGARCCGSRPFWGSVARGGFLDTVVNLARERELLRESKVNILAYRYSGYVSIRSFDALLKNRFSETVVLGFHNEEDIK